MKKIEFRVLGLSYSQSQVGSYVLVLSEIDGITKIPIIVKQSDAQYIALRMEGIKSPRPDIHDVVKSFTDNTGYDVQEIYIHMISEGLFYTKLIIGGMTEDFEIECSIGDAIALSIVYGCPIMVSDQVIIASGIRMSDDGVISDEDQIENRKDRKPVISIENLEMMLEKAIENEEYEIASQLRDRITELKKLNISQ